MITSEFFLGTIPFAKKLSEASMRAVATPSTVVFDLTQTIIPPLSGQWGLRENEETTAPQIQGDFTPDACYLSYDVESVSRDVIEDGQAIQSKHSVLADAYIKDIANAVNTHISFARNVVKPIVLDFATAYQEFKQNYTPATAESTFEIVKCGIPSVLKDESFLDSIQIYKDKAAVEPSTRLSLTVKSVEELQTMVLTGQARVDKLIVEWLSNKEEGFLTKAYNQYFSKTVESDVAYKSTADLDTFEKADTHLAIYLLACKLYNDVQEVEGLSLAAYKTIMQEIRDYAGTVLAQSATRVAGLINSQTLVLSSDERERKIKVNAELYSDWLNAGGKPETILGLAISGQKVNTIPMIDQKTKEWQSAWDSYSLYSATVEKNNYFGNVKLFIRSQFDSVIKTLDQTEIDYAAKNPSYGPTIVKLMNEYLDGLKASDLEDVYGIALNVIARIRFFYTASYDILSDIHEASKVNPNIDVREAALLAAINYVSDYVADQIQLVA